MKNAYEILFAGVIVLSLVFLINPFNVLMPSMADMVIAVILVVAFSFFAGFVWKEKGGDERDNLHRLMADRFAYLVGSGVMLAGIISEILAHRINLWLVGGLALMIIAKISGLIYSRLHH